METDGPITFDEACLQTEAMILVEKFLTVGHYFFIDVHEDF